MFAAHIRNHHIDIVGIVIFKPLLMRSLRELDILYVMSAAANIADLNNPCEIIIAILPKEPHLKLEVVPATINLICPIEEYAIRDFISCWRTQMRLVIAPPQSAIAEKIILFSWGIGGIRYIIRNIPYPPNFKSTAARIIEPATGASTCALGSHKWKKYSGNFTRNAKFIITQVLIGINSVYQFVTRNILYEELII